MLGLDALPRLTSVSVDGSASPSLHVGRPWAKTGEGGMTPNAYAADIVLPTLREFLAERGSQRRAVLACIAVYHMVDYLAQARVPEGLSKGAARKAREREAQTVRDALARICAPALAVVQGICNGTKHADPIETKNVPAFAFDVPGAGWDQGRWDVPGLEVEHEGEQFFIDGCAQAVMLTLRALYAADIDPIDLTFFDQIFRGQPGWQEPPSTST